MLLLSSVCVHANKHTSTTEEFKPMTTPEKDLEKSKLHEEEIDADGEVKGSGTNLNPADDD